MYFWTSTLQKQRNIILFGVIKNCNFLNIDSMQFSSYFAIVSGGIYRRPTYTFLVLY